MPESLLSRRLKLGTFLGIGLYVHWSFLLVIAFVVVSMRSAGAAGIAFALAQLFGVFFCVTLHEYGHAMAARRFGIGTADITLLPIGGVARLRRMPRIPWQELVVAVAGPAVNVVIVMILLVGFFVLIDASVLYAVAGFLASSVLSVFDAVTGSEVAGAAIDDATIATVNEIFNTPSVGFAVSMLIVNMMLVVFNMIPAFPMDGGRVFRSLLAMTMDYRKATTIAARVGLVCAAMMALLSLYVSPSNPIPVLIAAFVGYAGIAEARHVEVMESVRGLTVGQVMIRTESSLPMDMPVDEIVQHWQSVSVPAMPVRSLAGTVVGMLQLREVVDAMAAGMNSTTTTAGQLIDHESSVGTVRPDEALESALLRTGKQRRQIPVVDDDGKLIGILDLDSMLARSELSKQVRSMQSEPQETRPIEGHDHPHFDQTS